MTEPTILRVDRLAAIVDVLAGAIERAPIDLGTLPPAVATLAKAAKWAGYDLPELARTMTAGSLRRLPSAAASDPERADRMTAWAVHAIAWLAGQTDDPPPAIELG